jgi:hypothetical protein
MTEYFMDDDEELVNEPATDNDLAAWAVSFQRQHFGGPIPTIEVCFNTHPRFRGIAQFDSETMTIHLSCKLKQFPELAQIALLHEMIHANLFTRSSPPDADRDHGQRFTNELKRLIRNSAYERLL